MVNSYNSGFSHLTKTCCTVQEDDHTDVGIGDLAFSQKLQPPGLQIHYPLQDGQGSGVGSLQAGQA